MGKPVVLSLNPGIGSHLSAYQSQGFNVGLAVESRPLERQSIAKNLGIPTSEGDPRKFYNRKQKGVDDLLQSLGLTEVGALDVLDVTTNLSTYDDQRRPQNLFDVFGIARRLEPKVVIAFAPQEVAESKNRQRFNSFLDYLRYDSLRNPELRKYFVNFATLDAADFGSSVRKRVTLVIGVRSDIAAASDLFTDQGILALLPKSEPVSTLGNVASSTDPNDDDFWFLQTAKDLALKKAIQFLSKEPSLAEILSLSPRQKKECGYKKSQVVRIARASFGDAIPDPTTYHVIHPKQSRLLTNLELQNAFGFPRDWRHVGNEVQVRSLVEQAIPTPFVDRLISQVVLPLLNGTAKVGSTSDNRLEKIRLAETLCQSGAARRTYQVPIDIGLEASCDRLAELPSPEDYDFLFDANEINQDFVVYGPYDPEIGRRPIVGAIQRKVFQNKDRRNLMKAVDRVKETTGARIGCASVPISAERLAKYDSEGRTYEVAEDGRSFRLWVEAKTDVEAHWDRWRTEEMPSAMYGWHRDKNTRLPTLSKTMANNAKVRQEWSEFNATVEHTYRKLAPDDFKKQAKFLRSWVPQKCRLGGSIFTTMSIQRYGPNLPSMAFHIDAGDDNSGLTTISVVDDGAYEGGYFVIPRYRCAFRVGDGDVFVANSRQVHGVSETTGDGHRYSVVSYSMTKLGRKQKADNAYPPKSPRPKFRMDRYQIAIPSFMRDETLAKKTLKVLEKYKVDPKRVTIFMANEEERKKYAKTLASSPYQNLVIAQKGIKEVRNFMWTYYPEGTPVLFMDDDLEEIQVLEGPKRLIPATDLFEDVVKPGFHAMRENHAYLWGIYAAGNAGFMSGTISMDDDKLEHHQIESISVGNFYIIGSFFGAIIRHDPELLVGTADKEDNERSVLHFIKDGRVVRLDFATVKSGYYTEKGGLQETRTADTVKIGADYMLQRYPKYVRIFQRNTGAHAGMWEVDHL